MKMFDIVGEGEMGKQCGEGGNTNTREKEGGTQSTATNWGEKSKMIGSDFPVKEPGPSVKV